MTAIKDELRQLDAARARGEITETELQIAKSKLHDSVEEANLLSETRRPHRRVQPKRPSNAGFWPLLAMGLCGVAMMTLLLGALLGSFTLALTLVLSLAAGVLVLATRQVQSNQ
ncbi:SHOCT domain-containing protein [Epibacterium ulvae]|uniref:Short C-terminal domain-containing protein n=1 Tax=Epibacterium ulvae TaxID=1156985 RepID=A0A1G5QYE4_9RHOB|nr:SHOCT domain-containing protein [Epibacterium ulvae]SCZ66736.1 hypothetical protein SAMN04488118_106246 [Epibacterium ulvae]